jgi:hypothetical protein
MPIVALERESLRMAQLDRECFITGLAGTGRSRAFLAELIACRFVMGGTQTMEANMGVGRGVLLWILGVPIASSFCWRCSGTIRND